MSNKIRIAYNMWPFSSVRAGGMAYYALSLLREFCHFIPDQLLLTYGPHSTDLLNTLKSVKNVRSVLLKDPQEIYDFRSDFDVLFTPNIWSGANMLDYPLVHVIPDIQEEFYPEFFSDFELNARHIHHPLAAKASTLLITISNYSKDTIVEKFNVPEKSIRVTHLGSHPIFSDQTNPGVRPRMMPRTVRKYLFYPAHVWKHKNHIRLLDAMSELEKSNKLDFDMIFTGHLLEGDSNRVDLHREINSRKLGDRVFHIGTVSLSELKYLYMNASGLVHPSLFEGFGIPLVEAMKCGCPIVAADRTSIPELCGDAALYFNPDDPCDIADKLSRFLTHPDENENRIRIGKARATLFSDEQTAKSTIGMLEEAYELASVPGLKRKALSELNQSNETLVTAIIVFTKYLDSFVISEINRISSEFGDNLEFIAVVQPDMKYQSEKMLPASTKILVLENDLPSLIGMISKEIKGRYVFMSDGSSIIHQTFLYYLKAYEASLPSQVQMFFGDSILLKTGGRLRDSFVPLGINDDEMMPYCCSTLSFVVRSETFQDVTCKKSTDCDNIFQIAEQLWTSSVRRRLYKIIQLSLEADTQDMQHKIDIAIGRIYRRISVSSYGDSLARFRLFDSLLRKVLLFYFNSPTQLRFSIHGSIMRFRKLFLNRG